MPSPKSRGFKVFLKSNIGLIGNRKSSQATCSCQEKSTAFNYVLLSLPFLATEALVTCIITSVSCAISDRSESATEHKGTHSSVQAELKFFKKN